MAAAVGGIRTECDTGALGGGALQPATSRMTAMARARLRTIGQLRGRCATTARRGISPEGEPAQRAELAREVGPLVVGIEAARVGQHPQGGPLEQLILEAHAGAGPSEPDPVRAEAQHGDAAWTVPPHLGPQPAAAPPELLGR